MLRTLMALMFLAQVFASPAFADPPRANHYHWRNTDYPSHYLQYDYASRTWLETVDCRVLWRFHLESNGVNQLDLIDDSRGMRVRLNYEGMWLKAAGAADYSFYQRGTFDTRTQFFHYDAAGNFTGAITKKPGCVWDEQFAGQSAPTFHFVQSAISNAAVEIYDASRTLWVLLSGNRMDLRQGTGPYGFFKNGHWD